MLPQEPSRGAEVFTRLLVRPSFPGEVTGNLTQLHRTFVAATPLEMSGELRRVAVGQPTSVALRQDYDPLANRSAALL